MVLTRFQQAALNSRDNKKENTTTERKNNVNSSANERNEAALVQDPPLLNISRSKDSFDDDLNETAIKVELFLEQLDE